jgi:23S rRNA (cytidine1920-2'-O)/16S rRNA (cytidine1409-2'-O)-methyltransferase
MRLDLYLVENGYFDSRNKAKLAIDSNNILINGKVINKGSYDVKPDDVIEIQGTQNPYVSRGGLKLEAALKSFYVDVKGKTVLDIGASTGGFTDCALQFGAKKVYAVDVGTDQLHEKLLYDPRVISLEQTNIIDIDYFPEPIDLLVMDVSFVSIEYMLPNIIKHINEDNALICLIKPQFELGKTYMKNGIVKDRRLHIKVLENVINECEKYNLGITKLITSPILGGSGNKEFLAYIKLNEKTKVNVIELFNKE